MAADEQLRAVEQELLLCFGVVARRVAADVAHQHRYVFTGKNQLFREFIPHLLVIDIPVYAAKGFQVFQWCCHPVAKITGMPDFIAVAEKAGHSRVKPAMGV